MSGMPARIPIGLAAREGQPDLSTLAQGLDELADLGLDMVELPAYAFDLLVGGRPLQGRIRELELACRDRSHGFTVHGPLATNFMAPAPRLPRFLEVTKAFVEIAARIGARHLVVHAGMLQEGELAGAEDAYARQREWLAKAGEFAAPHGVILCVENLFDWPPFVATPSPARLAREIAAIGHPAVRATFDLSHGFIHAAQHGHDFLAEAEALAPYARHLHLHDSFGQPDLPWTYAGAEAVAFGTGDLHLPLGWGALPWDAIAERCRFPAGVVAIHELNPRFWRDQREAIAASRGLADRLRTA
ncbi:sugar phosphate isomerase/epimerase family protein [Labrys wisconsinensis]|uniref:Sugar phosphate isomerase/epimerase n=1 Tax=Labrys wisconsinensis TaxID=425677 RepID=A0ABU0IZN1_9HYPH|nr:sugar phosphate isomerase/epimerase family protein [Labrys wisconsinensis]MDQ0467464.1 sugar phosphate isomerase/epimerase [Labrys wisconsinensis]